MFEKNPVAASLAGELVLHPGRPRPRNLQSTRPDWLHRLTNGVRADALPDSLASLFNSCGHAHRMCATWALEAARGSDAAVAGEGLAALHTETLREHLRRMALDWPRRLLGAAEDPERQQEAWRCLRLAPVLPGRPLAEWQHRHAEVRPWLEAHWLGMCASLWLDGWQRHSGDWLAQWSEEQGGWFPRLLRASRDAAQAVVCPTRALRVHADEAALQAFAAQLDSGGTTRRAPRWQGACAETGAWTRLSQAEARAHDTPWMKLGARIAELVRLAAHPSASVLRAGRLHLGKDHGIAWLEMARGLLIHHVRLDGPRVAQCHVVAPTDWNFHPEGMVAAALEPLEMRQAKRIMALMAAYDPCVDYRVEFNIEQREAADA